MKSLAALNKTPQPCFVCGAPTQLLRSLTHLKGPPTGPTDPTPICTLCDKDWTVAIYQTQLQTYPP